MSERTPNRPSLTEDLRSAREELRRLRRLGAVLHPSETEGLEFTDLFDLDDIQQVQDVFARATGVASFITAPDGTPLTQPSNFCRLCSDVVRASPEGLKRCIASDAFFGRRGSSGPVISHCLSAGLLEGGAPITAGDAHLANWLVGQVRDEAKSEREMLRYAEKLGVDTDTYLAALREIPVMDREQFGRICDALYLFARLMSRQALFNLRQAREIQRRRRMLGKLKQSRRIADTLLNATPDAAFLVDMDGNILAANTPAATRHGFDSTHGMTGLNISRFMDWDTFEQRLHQVHDCLCSGDTMTVEEAMGGQVFINYLTPVYDDSSRASAVAVFSREVTEERRLQRLRDDVERIARHDIKSPLTGIIGLSRLLAGQDNLTRRQQDVAATIAEAASATLQKLNTQFDLFRMEEGTYVLKAARFDLAATLRRIAQVLHTITRHKALELELSINGEELDQNLCAMLHGEEFHIEGMLHNLIQNAIEAAPKQTCVRVNVDMGLSGCVIDIHNMGAVPANIRHRFFDKYATSGKASGTGLGTYSARLIARAHQGDIAYSTKDSDGTTVTITLPQPGGEFFPQGAEK